MRSPGEALENRVGPLVEGGELERLEGADGDTGKESDKKEGMERGYWAGGRAGWLVESGESGKTRA